MLSLSADGMKDYEKRHLEKKFCWKRVEIFAFRNADGGPAA